jgi:glycosyltransferase involved in cell wall biosynthesis
VPESSGRRELCVIFSQNEAAVRQQLQELIPGLRRRLPGDMEVVIKPHPRERDHEAYWGRTVGEGIRLAAADDDTYRLLGRCRLAVSVFSSVAVEALAYGCASVVLRSPFWNEDIRGLVEAGALIPATDADEVAAALARPTSGFEAQARSMFGVGEPEPDFARLIDDLQRRRG